MNGGTVWNQDYRGVNRKAPGLEIRELIAAGIVRPQDIQSDNTDLTNSRALPSFLWALERY